MRILGLLAVAAGALVAVQLASRSVLADVDPAQESEEGTMIQIGPDHGVSVDVRVDGDRAAERRESRRGRRALRQPGFVEAPQAVSRYWIGIGGGALPPEFRAQLDIDSDEGVLVRTVAPESPAAEGGVERFDIILRANGEPVSQLGRLAEIVGDQGEAKGRVTLDLLRSGKRKTVWVTPIERPMEDIVADAPRRRVFGGQGRGALFGPDGIFGDDAFGAEGFGLGEGGLGGGELGGLMEALPQMAAGVSVSVAKQGEGPAMVTVTRGDKTWTFESDDQESIAALPGDVRPMVERMLQQNGGVFQPGFEGFGLDTPGFQLQLNDDIARRARAMQERMQALRGQLGAGAPAGAAAAEPEIELDEAPAFGSGVPAEPAPESGPVELEIPATADE